MAAFPRTYASNLDGNLYDLHNPAKLSDLVHSMIDRISNTLDHSLYDIKEDKVSPTKIRHIASKSHKLGDLTLQQCTDELQDAFYQLGHAAQSVQQSLDRFINTAIAEGRLAPRGPPTWVHRVDGEALLGETTRARKYRARRRSEWVKDKAKEQEEKRRMSLRKYAEPLPGHRPIPKRRIRKGMSMTRRPTSLALTSRRRAKEAVKVVDSDKEVAKDGMPGTTRMTRSSRRLEDKGLLSAVEEHIRVELEDYTSD